MILINVPDPNLAIEYLRAIIENESSFDKLRSAITEKAYALSVCSTAAYSDTISGITANAKSMALRGATVDEILKWVEQLKNVDDIYVDPFRDVGEKLAYEMLIRRAVELGI